MKYCLLLLLQVSLKRTYHFCHKFILTCETQINQLDFLLNKASQYSDFITKDLEGLQAAMTENARRKVQKSEKRSKKRKADGKESSKKKSNKNSGEELKSALVKDAKVRAGSKPIFVQPLNLAPGCVLKDYQLEGVLWLASLFENGVSGILADEVCVSFG
jgi:ATP-dependent DNA helicase